MSGRVSVHFVTLGCPKNEVDSDHMAARVSASAFDVVPELDAADVAVVNTCAFIRDATEESIEAVLDLAVRWKAMAPGRALVVAGCLATRFGADLADQMPEVDAFVPVADEDALLAVIERLTGQPAEASDGPGRTPSGPSAYLQVADGCFRRCSYCAIPLIRGGYRSRPLGDLTTEAELLVASGAREIVLVGQDISSYGRDLGDSAPSLVDVVRAVSDVDGLAWLRLMYVQPEGITPELLEVMAERRNICRYLDLPMQHAARALLKRMNRTGSGDEFLRLLGVVRSCMPDVALRTSVIAGFPGETDTDVEVLEDFLLLARFDYAGVFTYSAEEGTQAATMPDQVPEDVKLARTRRLRDAADIAGFEKAAAHVGETLEVLVEPLGDEEEPHGRWRGQAPEVDGVVYLDVDAAPGALVSARVVDAAGYDLFGEVAR